MDHAKIDNTKLDDVGAVASDAAAADDRREELEQQLQDRAADVEPGSTHDIWREHAIPLPDFPDISTVERCETWLSERWTYLLEQKMAWQPATARHYSQKWLRETIALAENKPSDKLKMLQMMVALPYSSRQEILLADLRVAQKLIRSNYSATNSPRNLAYQKFETCKPKDLQEERSARVGQYSPAANRIDDMLQFASEFKTPEDIPSYLIQYLPVPSTISISQAGVTNCYTKRHACERGNRAAGSGIGSIWNTAVTLGAEQFPSFYLREYYSERAQRESVNMEDARVEAETKYWVQLEGPYCANTLPPGDVKPTFQPDRVLPSDSLAVYQKVCLALAEHDQDNPLYSSIFLFGSSSPGVHTSNLVATTKHQHLQALTQLYFPNQQVVVSGDLPSTDVDDWANGPNFFHRDIHSINKKWNEPYVFDMERARSDFGKFLAPLSDTSVGGARRGEPIFLIAGYAAWYEMLFDVDKSKSRTSKDELQFRATEKPILFQVGGRPVFLVGTWTLLNAYIFGQDAVLLQRALMNLVSTALNLILTLTRQNKVTYSQADLDAWMQGDDAQTLLRERGELNYHRLFHLPAFKMHKSAINLCGATLLKENITQFPYFAPLVLWMCGWKPENETIDQFLLRIAAPDYAMDGPRKHVMVVQDLGVPFRASLYVDRWNIGLHESAKMYMIRREGPTLHCLPLAAHPGASLSYLKGLGRCLSLWAPDVPKDIANLPHGSVINMTLNKHPLDYIGGMVLRSGEHWATIHSGTSKRYRSCPISEEKSVVDFLIARYGYVKPQGVTL